MSETWYFNQTIIGTPPSQEVQYAYNFTSNGAQYTSIALYPFLDGIMYVTVSGSAEITYQSDSGWKNDAYRTIELTEPATGDFLTFLSENATSISSGPVDPDPPTSKLVNKVILGSDTVLDLTSDTVTPETLLVGTTAHNAKGEIITGTLVPCTVYSAESPAATTSNSDRTFTWEIPSTEHGFKSKNLVVSVYLSTGEQIQCDVTISDTFMVALTAVYSSDIVTRAGDVTIPAGYLRDVIIGPVETTAAVQQAMLNQLQVYTGGGNY